MAHTSQQLPDHSTLIAEARRSALDMGTEDINGFWELLWTLRLTFPQVDDDTLSSASKDALGELLEEDLIRVVQWDPDSRIDQVVPGPDARQLIENPASWASPDDSRETHPRFIATSSGERVYYAGLTSAEP